MLRSASVKDVAATAGVSLGTVSNVLNRPERVSPSTRARVEQAMADLGFVRNESARQLRAGKSRLLAYVMLDATNPFFTDVASGVEDAAEAADLSLFMCNSSNSATREKAYLEHLVEQRVQGILITPVDPDSSTLDRSSGAGPHWSSWTASAPATPCARFPSTTSWGGGWRSSTSSTAGTGEWPTSGDRCRSDR